MSREFTVPGFVYWLGAPFLLFRLAQQKRFGVLMPLEKAVLDLVLHQAPKSLASALQSQMSEVNHALRTTTNTSEVVLFKISGIRPDLSRSILLPISEGDAVIGTVSGMVDGLALKAKLFAVDRVLFSIEFDNDVRQLLNKTNLELANVTISDDVATY